MRFFSISLIILISLFFNTAGFANSGRPEISQEPLTHDQIAVYRAVLEDHLENSKSDLPLYLANKTNPFFPMSYASRLLMVDEMDSSHFSHKLAEAVILNLKIVLADPDEHRGFNKQSDSSVERTIGNHLLTVFEIFFDKCHEHALTAYYLHSFEVRLIILRKVGNKWKIEKKWTEVII